jgi:hypothetical protein
MPVCICYIYVIGQKKIRRKPKVFNTMINIVVTNQPLRLSRRCKLSMGISNQTLCLKQ